MVRQMNWLAAGLLACLLTMAASRSDAQMAEAPYPSRPIKFVLGVSVGGVTDTIARLIAHELEVRWGQPVIIEPRTGASGTLASAFTARAAPDGYTLTFLISTHSTATLFQKDLRFDPLKDFSPITMVAQIPIVLAKNAKIKGDALADVVAYAKAHPNTLSYASNGVGGMFHMTGELFNQAAGLRIAHVPYKGSTPELNDLIGGHIPLAYLGVGFVSPYHASGQAKGIAIAAPKRLPSLPDVPTFTELGYPQIVVNEWIALAGPAGMPREIVDKLNREVRDILSLPAIQARAGDTPIVSSTPEELGDFMRAEVQRWSKLVHELGLAR